MKKKLVQGLLLAGAFVLTVPAFANLSGQMTDDQQDTLEQLPFSFIEDSENLFDSEADADEDEALLIYPEVEVAGKKARSCSCAGIKKNGRASWYKYTGRPTATGEKFTGGSMTAAHPCLKFGTRVTVCRTKGRRCASLRVNDRGPYTGGRILDVSSAGAGRLGMKSAGVVSIQITSCR